MKGESKTKLPVSTKKTKVTVTDDFQSTDFTGVAESSISVKKTITKSTTKKVAKKVAKKIIEQADEITKAPGFKTASSYDLSNFPRKKKGQTPLDEQETPSETKTRSGRRIKDLASGPIDHSKETSKYAMEIKTDQGATIKKVFDNISSLLKTVDIRFYPQGIYICASDLAKYTLISIALNAEQFLKYYCPNRIKITLDINALNSALSNAQNLETLSFIFREKDARTLFLVLESKGKKKNIIKLFGTTSENKTFRVPRQQFENPMVFKATEFQSDIRSMCPYSPLVTFVTNYKKFHILASGDQGSSHLQMNPESKEAIEQLRKTNQLGDSSRIAIDPNSIDTTEKSPEMMVQSISKDDSPMEEENSELDKPASGSEDDAIPIAETEESGEDARVKANLDAGEELAKKIPSNIEKYFVEDDQITFDEPPKADVIPTSNENQSNNDDELDDLEEKFDESYVSGLYILRYFHTICKNTNLGNYVEIMLKNGEYVTLRYPINTLGYLTFSVLQCIQ